MRSFGFTENFEKNHTKILKSETTENENGRLNFDEGRMVLKCI